MHRHTLLLPVLALNLALLFGRAQANPPIQQTPTPRLFLPMLVRGFPAAISDSQREEVLNAIQARFEAVKGGGDVAVWRQALADYIRTLPYIAAAGVTEDDSVWGRFTDDRLLIIAPPPIDPPAVDIAIAESGPAPAAPDDLPGADTVYIMNAMGTCFVDPTPSITRWFNVQKYTVATAAASVSGLQTVHDAGVFFINTHGGTGHDRQGNAVYTLWTATARTPQGDGALADDLDAGRLVYVLAENDRAVAPAKGCVNAWHYAITPAFVSKYMRFAAHSFVYFSGCGSASPAAADFVQAFHGAGAASYAGWSLPVGYRATVPAAGFLFDRMLGTNDLLPPTPPQRPFDLASVYRAMHQYGFDTETYCSNHAASCPPSQQVTTTLIFDPPATVSAQGFTLLAPTIEHGETLDPVCCSMPDIVELDLYGLFGSEQGKVFVGGAPLNVLSWMTDTIRAELPPNGPGSAGDIVVSVRDHTSNAVPLTEWRGRVSWRQDYAPMWGPGPYAEVTCNLHFRSEFHRFRTEPEDAPAWPEYARVTDSQDSHCSWTMGGQATWIEPATGHVWRHVLSGSGDLYGSEHGTGPWVVLGGVIQPGQKQMLVSVNGNATGQWTVYDDDEFRYTTGQLLAGTGPVTLPLDAGFNILPGMSTFDSSDDGPSTTSWGNIPAQYAPNDQTPG